MTATGLAITVGIALLTITNPSFHTEAPAPQTSELPRDGGRSTLQLRGMPSLLGLSVIVATTLVGTDLLLLAKLREVHQPGAYALVVAVWTTGSMIGGLIYGARPRSWPAGALTVALNFLTAGMIPAHSPAALAVAGFLAGLACAPAMTALTDEITRLAPSHRQSEALGWYSSAHTVGASVGSTVVGGLIDGLGPSMAALVVSLGGGMLAAGLTVITRRAGRGGATGGDLRRP